jgi:hypothetical protein
MANGPVPNVRQSHIRLAPMLRIRIPVPSDCPEWN